MVLLGVVLGQPLLVSRHCRRQDLLASQLAEHDLGFEVVSESHHCLTVGVALIKRLDCKRMGEL